MRARSKRAAVTAPEAAGIIGETNSTACSRPGSDDGPQDVPARLTRPGLGSAAGSAGWLARRAARLVLAGRSRRLVAGRAPVGDLAIVAVLTVALVGVSILRGTAILDRIRASGADRLPAPSALPAPTATPAPTQVVAIATSTAPDASPGPMITPRSHAGVARLSDGRILVVGGVDQRGRGGPRQC